jgi:UDP-N-acetylmuramyl pentapeptide phosphotransferase/UDP-N-acetylglucosamine-1-phosphate transferase
LAPIVLLYLYKFKAWRRDVNSKETILDESGEISKIINKNDKDLKTPRMGGLVIVFSVIFTIVLF